MWNNGSNPVSVDGIVVWRAATYSLIEGADLRSPDTGNFDGTENPLFTDPDGGDNILGTPDDDFGLQPNSPYPDRCAALVIAIG